MALFSTPAAAAPQITLVKQIGSTTYASYTYANSINVTVPAGGVAQGNTIIITAENSTLNAVATSATDTKGNIYTVDISRAITGTSSATNIISAYVNTALVGGDTIKVTFSSSAALLSALATEWSGIAPAGRVDQKASGQGGTTGLSSTAAPATTSANDLLIGSFAGSVNASFTAGSGYTPFATQLSASLGSTYRPQWQEYRIVSATGAYTATGTASASGGYAGAIVAYKANAAAPDTAPPSVPVGITQTSATMTSVGLSWSASTDDVGVAGYDLYKNGAPSGTTAATNTLFTGLSCGTTYSFSIDAYDAAGNKSAQSPFVTSTADCDTTPPSTPTGLAVVSTTQNSVGISWNASTDNVGVTGYGLYKNGSSVGNTPPTNSTFTGLSCSTGYTLGVNANDAAGNASNITTIVVTTSDCPDTTPPSTPADLTQAGSTATSADVSWTAATDNVGVVGYGLYKNGVLTGSTANTAATFSGLNCATTYTLAVDAFDAAGNRSAQVSTLAQTAVCPPDTTPPSTPSSLLVNNATVSSLRLSWSASADNIGVTGYGVYNGGPTPIDTTAAINYTFGGLSCGTSYSLGVDAFDAAGNRSSVATASGTTSPCPDVTPPSVSVTAPADGATVSGSSVTVSANASDNVGVAGVQFKLDGANLGSELTAGPYTRSWNSTTVTNGSHTLTAIARDAAGNTTTATTITVSVSNSAPSSPTPIPSASTYGITVGTGFTEDSARQVVRTANNLVYIITADDTACQGSGSGVIRVFKGNGAQASNPNIPTGFSEVNAANHPVSAGAGNCTYGSGSILQSPESRLDPAGTIHMAYIDGASHNVYYQTFSTVSDTWGSRIVIGTGANSTAGGSWPRTGQLALTLDANNVPHVTYVTTGASNNVMYVNKVSGSWSAPVALAAGTNLAHPSMTTALDGTIHLAWLADAAASHSNIYYAHYVSGIWGSAEKVSAGDSLVLNNTDDDQGPVVATDSHNTPQVVFMDGTGSGSVSVTNNYVRLRIRAANGVWTDNSPPGNNGGASSPNGTLFAHCPQNYIAANGDNYIFTGHNIPRQFAYDYQLGGVGQSWSPYTVLDPRSNTSPGPGDTVEPGIDGSPSVRFDPLRDNNTGIIDVIYYDERYDAVAAYHHGQIYYKAIVIGSN